MALGMMGFGKPFWVRGTTGPQRGSSLGVLGGLRFRVLVQNSGRGAWG